MADSASRMVEALTSLQATINEQNETLKGMAEALKTTHERLEFLEGLALDHEKRLKALETGR